MKVKFRTKGVKGSKKPGRFSADSVLDTIHNVFYTGVIAHYPTAPLNMNDDIENPERIQQPAMSRRKPDAVYLGRHEPLITLELWLEDQSICESKQKTPSNAGKSDRVYMLSGIAQCWECQRFVKPDRTVTLRGSTNGSGKQIYRCASLHGRMKDRRVKVHETPHDLVHQPDAKAPDIRAAHKLSSLPAELLEPQVDALMKSLILPKDWHEHILAYAISNDGLSEYYCQRYNLQQELQRIKEQHEAKIIDAAEMKSRSIRLASELNRLTPMADPRAYKLLPLLTDFSILWDQMSPLEKRGLLKILFEGLYFDGEGKLREARARAPFDRILGLKSGFTI